MKMLELNAAVISQLKERDPSFPDVTAGVLVPQVQAQSP
jgi:HtrA serine peptidase 2